jgi:hypothetical protein
VPMIKETLLTSINLGDFELEDMLERIDTEYVRGNLTAEDLNELTTAARQFADPRKSLPTADERLSELERRVACLEKALNLSESGVVVDDEFVEFLPPTSADKTYMTGDKVKFLGERYICKVDNTVFNPLAMPESWEKVTG